MDKFFIPVEFDGKTVMFNILGASIYDVSGDTVCSCLPDGRRIDLGITEAQLSALFSDLAAATPNFK